jgi:hypothetical protein
MSFIANRNEHSVSGRIGAYFLVVLSLAAIAALPIGCGSGDVPLAEADPEAVPEVTSWEQVFSIFQRECLPCHGQGGKEPRLETCADIIDSYESSLEQIFQKNEMPPGAWPRLSSEEKLIIERFGGDAPCL